MSVKVEKQAKRKILVDKKFIEVPDDTEIKERNIYWTKTNELNPTGRPHFNAFFRRGNYYEEWKHFEPDDIVQVIEEID